MSKGRYSETVRLARESDSKDKSDRIAVITTLLNNAESKINHFDRFRQRNLLTALAIFAAVFTFGVQARDPVAAELAGGTLFLVMGFLYYVDHQLHKYSEGWQATRGEFIQRLCDAVNDRSRDLEFPQYLDAEESNASFFSPRLPLLYLLLTVGGPAALIILPRILDEVAA